MAFGKSMSAQSVGGGRELPQNTEQSTTNNARFVAIGLPQKKIFSGFFSSMHQIARVLMPTLLS